MAIGAAGTEVRGNVLGNILMYLIRLKFLDIDATCGRKKSISSSGAKLDLESKR